MSAGLLQMSGAVVDLLYNVDSVPQAGQEAIVNRFSIAPGGGFNAMIAAMRAGIEVHYGGALGCGPFAGTLHEGLTGNAIPVLRERDTQRDQGCCTVLIDNTGERTFIASDGAEGHATIDELRQIEADHFDFALLSGYALHYPGSRDAICQWLQYDPFPRHLVFDPSPVVAALPAEALVTARNRASWISANLNEAATLTGTRDPLKAANTLAQGAPKDGGAIVRTGADGCVVATASRSEWIPAYPVHAIDTNGAGDTHVGSFIAQLAQGADPFEAARYANVAAALSTTHHGPATAPDKSTVIAALDERKAG